MVQFEVELPVREPFDADGIFHWLAVRSVPSMEVASATSYARTLGLPSGPAWFEVRSEHPSALILSAHTHDQSDANELLDRVRRLFAIDVDPEVINAALSRHAELEPLVSSIPGIRVPGSIDPHEMLIRAMIGQQVSVSSARTALTRLVEALGETVETPDGEQRHLFPALEVIAERGHEVLRGPAARIRAITEAAAALADGTLTLGFDDDATAQRSALLARRGIGPWTADYVRMRVLNDPDVILPGDSAVRNGARRVGIPAEARELERWSARVAPWRSYLTAHLWRANAADHPAFERR